MMANSGSVRFYSGKWAKSGSVCAGQQKDLDERPQLSSILSRAAPTGVTRRNFLIRAGVAVAIVGAGVLGLSGTAKASGNVRKHVYEDGLGNVAVYPFDWDHYGPNKYSWYSEESVYLFIKQGNDVALRGKKKFPLVVGSGVPNPPPRPILDFTKGPHLGWYNFNQVAWSNSVLDFLQWMYDFDLPGDIDDYIYSWDDQVGGLIPAALHPDDKNLYSLLSPFDPAADYLANLEIIQGLWANKVQDLWDRHYHHDWTHLNHAITRVESGKTLTVMSRTPIGGLNQSFYTHDETIVIEIGMTITGEPEGSPTIAGRGIIADSAEETWPVLTVWADAPVTIENLTIQYDGVGFEEWSFAIICVTSAEVRECRITPHPKNGWSFRRGIGAYYRGGPELRVDVIDNPLITAYYPIQMEGCLGSLISGNTLVGVVNGSDYVRDTFSEHGISANFNQDLTIENNVIYAHHLGIFLFGDTNSTINAQAEPIYGMDAAVFLWGACTGTRITGVTSTESNGGIWATNWSGAGPNSDLNLQDNNIHSTFEALLLEFTNNSNVTGNVFGRRSKDDPNSTVYIDQNCQRNTVSGNTFTDAVDAAAAIWCDGHRNEILDNNYVETEYPGFEFVAPDFLKYGCLVLGTDSQANHVREELFPEGTSLCEQIIDLNIELGLSPPSPDMANVIEGYSVCENGEKLAENIGDASVHYQRKRFDLKDPVQKRYS